MFYLGLAIGAGVGGVGVYYVMKKKFAAEVQKLIASAGAVAKKVL